MIKTIILKEPINYKFITKLENIKAIEFVEDKIIIFYGKEKESEFESKMETEFIDEMNVDKILESIEGKNAI